MAVDAPVAPTPPAPAPAPSGVKIIEGPPPKPLPRPTESIQVSRMPPPVEPGDKAKVGSARSRLAADLQKVADKRAGVPQPTRPAPELPTTQKLPPQRPPPSTEAPPTPGPDEHTAPEPESTDETPAAESAETAETPVAPAEGKKPSPWKTIDEWKKRHAQLEKDYSELKGQLVPGEERKTISERLEKAEKRTAELEEVIRHVNYEKSAEFRDKYDEPYNRAFRNAMNELSELTVEDGNGNARPIAPDDIIHLATLPLRERKAMATQLFGEFADDVMNQVKEVKNLGQARQAAIEENRKVSAEREKQQYEQSTKQATEIQNQIRHAWNKENESAPHHPVFGEYVRPVEGDQEGNLSLAKGFELVDNAMLLNPHDPNLTPEQRAAIVRKHAAVRNRAAAYGRLVKWLKAARSERDELKAELHKLKDSEPAAAGSLPSPQENGATTAWGAVRQGLAKYAK